MMPLEVLVCGHVLISETLDDRHNLDFLTGSFSFAILLACRHASGKKQVRELLAKEGFKFIMKS